MKDFSDILDNIRFARVIAVILLLYNAFISIKNMVNAFKVMEGEGIALLNAIVSLVLLVFIPTFMKAIHKALDYLGNHNR
jgi:uncharacterized membrane protein